MNSELISVLEYLENERGIDRETLLSLVEDSLVSAAHKAVESAEDVSVHVDRQTGDIQAYATKAVVDEVSDPTLEMTPEEAQKHDSDAKVGDSVVYEVTPGNFGRIAAQTAKQVIMSRIRQAEKEHACEEYEEMVGQLISGMVRSVERGEIYIDFNRAEGSMRHRDKIPGEEYQPGDHITVLLQAINPESPGPPLIVSRADPDFVRRLFEREVAEIGEGLVEIRGVAREPGYRTKMAVHCDDERIDPVGSCVGLRGNRVKTVVRELGGEKVDIIRWNADVRQFVANALQPAKLNSVQIDEEGGCLRVEVPEDQLSLAIGKKGQNARLAAKLVGWRVDINKQEADEERSTFEDRIRRATTVIAEMPGIGEETAAKLVANGFLSLEGIVAAEVDDLAAIDDIDEDTAREVLEAARKQMGVE